MAATFIACVKMQLLPVIEFSTSNLVLPLRPRVKGSLTGTRVAGMIGKAIVVHAVTKASRDISMLPFPPAGSLLKFAVWVDNVYSMSESVQGAVSNLKVLERVLVNGWRLQLKPDSKLVIDALSKSRAGWIDNAGWQWKDPFPVLGHMLDSHGSAAADLAAAETACWLRFWMGAGSRRARRLPLSLLMKELERVCWPAWSFRSHWWPMTQSIVAAADRCQRTMLLTFLRMPKEKDEDVSEYAKRRHREASRLLHRDEKWGRRCLQRTVTWNEHILRNHAGAWYGPILSRRKNLSLLARRVWNGSASMFAGYLGLRLEAGRPRRRWEG